MRCIDISDHNDIAPGFEQLVALGAYSLIELHLEFGAMWPHTGIGKVHIEQNECLMVGDDLMNAHTHTHTHSHINAMMASEESSLRTYHSTFTIKVSNLNRITGIDSDALTAEGCHTRVAFLVVGASPKRLEAGNVQECVALIQRIIGDLCFLIESSRRSASSDEVGRLHAVWHTWKQMISA
jgi:hypothetical protein